MLRRTRDVVVDVPARHGDDWWSPTPGSLAEHDMAERAVADERENAYLFSNPRAVGSLYIYSGADYLAGIAALLREREVMLSPGALARAAFENGVRALLVLDPRCDSARCRAARALLNEVISAYHRKLTLEHLAGKGHDSFKSADRRFKNLRDLAGRSFQDVDWSGDPHRWTIEGENFPRMNVAAQSWSEWRTEHIAGQPPAWQAEGFYDALCLYSHPQSFSSREEARWGPDVDVPYWSTDTYVLAKYALGAFAAVVDAQHVLYGYMGWDAPELDEMADVGNALADSL